MIRRRQPLYAAAVLAAAFFLVPAHAATARLEHAIGANGSAVFRATGLGLSVPALEFLRTAPPAYLREVFWLRVAGADASAPAVAAQVGIEAEALTLRPRFPLQPGMRYHAALDGDRLHALLAAQGIAWGESSEAHGLLTQDIEVPAADDKPVAVVTQIFPTTDVLPENQLKFYLHFSAPMQQGGVYRHIKLYDGRGALVELPFLELDEELWDRSGTRFTLFIDPGRIKLGVMPREDVGVALQESGRFALVVESSWPDAAGRPLQQEFRKSFQVAPADRESPDPARWQVRVPRAGTRDPLVVEFGEPLDHALVQRLVWVHQHAAAVSGDATIGPRESSWTFVPAVPWGAGEYELRAGRLLEDLAGNSIARRFDRDLLAGETTSAEAGTSVSVPFVVR